MKKMTYESLACEVSVAENYVLISHFFCDYEKYTVAYAVERFFTRCALFRRECTWKSWQMRIAKGKARKRQNFQYFVPAVLMELPGNWVRICGDIDAVGVTVKRVEILKEYPWTADVRERPRRLAA